MSKLTLVAFYRRKPDSLRNFMDACLKEIIRSPIGDCFTPYSQNQTHATIIGLEWFKDAHTIINTNYFHQHGKKEVINTAKFAALIDQVFPVNIRFGGFDKGYRDFLSLGETPYRRSFLIDRKTRKAILIGWPHRNGNFQSKTLANLRIDMEQKCRIAHKYQQDNDLYFVLGNVKKNHGVNEGDFEQSLLQTESNIRNQLCKNPVNLMLNKEYLSLVHYVTTELKESTSKAFPLKPHYRELDQIIGSLSSD